jgi:hypothetical protein
MTNRFARFVPVEMMEIVSESRIIATEGIAQCQVQAPGDLQIAIK